MNGFPLRGFQPRQIIHSCTSHQSPRAELNRLPRPYQERALPDELQGHISEATERIGLSHRYFAGSRLPIGRCGQVFLIRSEWMDLNHRPPASDAGALPGCATFRERCLQQDLDLRPSA